MILDLIVRFFHFLENRYWWSACNFVDARDAIRESVALTLIFFGMLATIAGLVLTIIF